MPFFIGVAGGTGSGKTTVASRIANAMPTGSVALLDHDAYYRQRSDLSPEQRAQLNFDHPDALDTGLLVEHLDRLRGGEPIEVPIYDFVTHLRKPETRHVATSPVVIIEGILLFVDERLRQRLDLKLFVDTDADIRAFRRIRRDMELRGRTFQQISEQYHRTVRPMHLQFVEPSKRWADVIIPEGGRNDAALAMVLGRIRDVMQGDQP